MYYGLLGGFGFWVRAWVLRLWGHRAVAVNPILFGKHARARQAIDKTRLYATVYHLQTKKGKAFQNISNAVGPRTAYHNISFKIV